MNASAAVITPAMGCVGLTLRYVAGIAEIGLDGLSMHSIASTEYFC